MKPIRCYKLLAHEDDSRSTFATAFGYLFKKALVADTALALVRTAPQLLAAKRYLWTIESRLPKSNGRSVLLWYFRSAFGAVVLFNTAIFRSTSILVRIVWTVLSWEWRNTICIFYRESLLPRNIKISRLGRTAKVSSSESFFL